MFKLIPSPRWATPLLLGCLLAGCPEPDNTVSPTPGLANTPTPTPGPVVDPTPSATPTATTDADGDGYSASVDCNDSDGAINPAAEETCNGVDDDCDGLVDDDDPTVSGGTTWYLDFDGDGYGSDAVTRVQCAQPTSYVGSDTDCDDTDAAFNPGASEGDCSDANDYNCDGSTGFGDADGDGYAACEDCNDAEADIRPDADEICDGVDNDCDGLVDDADPGVTNQAPWYADADLDGYGDNNTAQTSCAPPEGYVAQGGDCDDQAQAYHPGVVEDDCADPNDYNCDGSVGFADGDGDGAAACEDCDDTRADINPSAQEVCNGRDDDCDGLSDDADDAPAGTSPFYLDSDGDGFGDPAATAVACAAPEGYVANADDCDDTDAGVRPDTLWYADTDQDTYGDPSSLLAACERPEGYVSNRADCDDTAAEINPLTTWYADYDSDGYGAATLTLVQCAQPEGFVSSNDDCDDTDPRFHPGADESDCADANDYNCDGSTAYDDSDADGAAACDDCDDGNAQVFPGAVEVCNGIDDDCDSLIDVDDGGLVGAITAYADNDNDTYGDQDDALLTCNIPEGLVGRAGDCDDNDPLINPETVWYIDYDQDGYGSDAYTLIQCQQPAGYVNAQGDCDDTAAAISPEGTETCDGDDEDCDTFIDESPAEGAPSWFLDSDEDGYGDPAAVMSACAQPVGYVANSADCDDETAATHPGVTELCDGIDNDCDGEPDAGALGAGATCAADSCLALKTELPELGDGIYWIEPDDTGPFQIFCDMSNDGGGWTLVANVDDVDDLFFNAFNRVAWEQENVRNEEVLPTFDVDINVSTKYQSFNALIVTDVRIAYKNDNKYFLCEGLSVNDTLPTIFSTVAARGACASTCTTFSENRLTEASLVPAGLNCNDANEDWFDGATAAENARIGAVNAPNPTAVMNGFLGALGDRGYSTSLRERTWAAYSSGAVWDDNIMLFVR